MAPRLASSPTYTLTRTAASNPGPPEATPFFPLLACCSAESAQTQVMGLAAMLQQVLNKWSACSHELVFL